MMKTQLSPRPLQIVVVALALLVFAPAARASLLGYWNFSESSGTIAHNQISGGPDGTLLGNAHFTPAGGILGGNAVRLDHATNDLVDFGNNFDITGSFSVVVWVRLAAGDTTPMIPLSKYESTGSPNGYFVGIGKVAGGQTNPHDAYAQFVQAGFSSTQTLPAINDGFWHMIVGRYYADEGITAIQVDTGGISGGVGPLPVSSDARFLVGGATTDGTPTNLLTGYIDEVRVYNSVLTYGESVLLYQATIPEPCSIGYVLASAIPFLICREPSRRGNRASD